MRKVNFCWGTTLASDASHETVPNFFGSQQTTKKYVVQDIQNTNPENYCEDKYLHCMVGILLSHLEYHIFTTFYIKLFLWVWKEKQYHYDLGRIHVPLLRYVPLTVKIEMNKRLLVKNKQSIWLLVRQKYTKIDPNFWHLRYQQASFKHPWLSQLSYSDRRAASKHAAPTLLGWKMSGKRWMNQKFTMKQRSRFFREISSL